MAPHRDFKLTATTNVLKKKREKKHTMQGCSNVPMLNSKTTTTVSMAHTEWLAISLGSRRKTSSVMSASATATFAANTGFRGSLRANAHISTASARTAWATRRRRPTTPLAEPSSTPHAACSPSGTPQSNASSGSRAPPRWSSVDRRVPSCGGIGGRPTGSAPIASTIKRSRRRRAWLKFLRPRDDDVRTRLRGARLGPV